MLFLKSFTEYKEKNCSDIQRKNFPRKNLWQKHLHKASKRHVKVKSKDKAYKSIHLFVFLTSDSHSV